MAIWNKHSIQTINPACKKKNISDINKSKIHSTYSFPGCPWRVCHSKRRLQKRRYCILDTKNKTQKEYEFLPSIDYWFCWLILKQQNTSALSKLYCLFVLMDKNVFFHEKLITISYEMEHLNIWKNGMWNADKVHKNSLMKS